MHITRDSRDRTAFTLRAGWLRVETSRSMVPVRQLSNPFAGIRRWKVVFGHLTLSWRS